LEIIKGVINLAKKKNKEDKLQRNWLPIIKEYYDKNKLYELLIDPVREKDEFIDKPLYILIDLAQVFNLPILDLLTGKIDESILQILKAKWGVDLDRQLMVDEVIMEQIEQNHNNQNTTKNKQQKINKQNKNDKIIHFPTKK
jgi:hypothetical protein